MESRAELLKFMQRHRQMLPPTPKQMLPATPATPVPEPEDGQSFMSAKNEKLKVNTQIGGTGPILSTKQKIIDNQEKRYESDNLKHTGFLGLVFLPDGSPMTEYSIKEPNHPKIKGTELQNYNFPTLVPKNKKHLGDIIKGNITKEIIDNAVEHALMRNSRGMSVFAEPSEIAFEGKDPIYLDERGRVKNVDIHGNKKPVNKDMLISEGKPPILT